MSFHIYYIEPNDCPQCIPWDKDWRWLGCDTPADYFNGYNVSRAIPPADTPWPSGREIIYQCVECGCFANWPDIPATPYTHVAPHTCLDCVVLNATLLNPQ